MDATQGEDLKGSNKHLRLCDASQVYKTCLYCVNVCMAMCMAAYIMLMIDSVCVVIYLFS